MRPVNWPTRLAALLQLFLVVPSLTSGSVCISADGVERLESGCCPCMALPASGAEMTLGATGTAECGPCRDDVFTAMRGATPPACNLPMAALPVLAPHVAAAVARIVECPLFWAGEPPGRRLPILRC